MRLALSSVVCVHHSSTRCLSGLIVVLHLVVQTRTRWAVSGLQSRIHSCVPGYTDSLAVVTAADMGCGASQAKRAGGDASTPKAQSGPSAAASGEADDGKVACSFHWAFEQGSTRMAAGSCGGCPSVRDEWMGMGRSQPLDDHMVASVHASRVCSTRNSHG